MIDLVPTSDKGRVFVGRAVKVDSEGSDVMVTLRLEPNTEDGRVVMSAEKALEVAVRLMFHAEAIRA